MNLQEVFDQLTFGELSMLKIGGDETGAIGENDYQKIVGSINLGLTAIFKRFSLKEGRLTLELVPGQTLYPLAGKFAHTREAVRQGSVSYEMDGIPPIVDNDNPYLPQFIVDTALNPFMDDVLKVEKVKTISGYEMNINVANDEYSIMTPSLTTIEVPQKVLDQGPDLPSELRGNRLTVFYQANHPKILVKEDFDPKWVELLLPESHLQALLYFVASRLYNPIGMMNEFNMGNNWYSKYELECQRLENEGLSVNQSNKEDNFRRNGWV